MHATVALARAAHGVQLAPHEFTLLVGRHIVGIPVAGQAWKPVSQVMPQVRGGPPPQFGLPFAGSLHIVHMFPHEVTLGLLSITHVVPQIWYPALQ